jgi:MtaA/CmuA family methyltransferase
MTVIDDIHVASQLGVPQRLPVFCLSQEFDAAYCGLTYAQYIRDADTVIRCQLRVMESFGWDWAWLHLDDTLEFEPLGVGVQAGENIVPATADYLPFTRDTLRGLRVPNPRASARMPLLLDAITGLRVECDDDKCITGRVAAPFSAVTLIFGMAQSFLVMMDDPELFMEALKFAEEQTLSWGTAQIEAGAHAIWCGDCSASTHLISPAHYEKWALEPCKRVGDAFKEAGAFTFLHNSEETLAGLRLQALTEPSLLSVGPGLDLAVAKHEFRGKQALMGNMDPIALLQLASASQVAGETKRQVQLMAEGGMVLNSGECVPREAKSPNLHTMYDTARKTWDLMRTGR